MEKKCWTRDNACIRDSLNFLGGCGWLLEEPFWEEWWWVTPRPAGEVIKSLLARTFSVGVRRLLGGVSRVFFFFFFFLAGVSRRGRRRRCRRGRRRGRRRRVAWRCHHPLLLCVRPHHWPNHRLQHPHQVQEIVHFCLLAIHPLIFRATQMIPIEPVSSRCAHRSVVVLGVDFSV